MVESGILDSGYLITIVELSGATNQVRIGANATVRELKDRIFRVTAVPLVAQKLLVGKVLLEADNQVVRDVVPELFAQGTCCSVPPDVDQTTPETQERVRGHANSSAVQENGRRLTAQSSSQGATERTSVPFVPLPRVEVPPESGTPPGMVPVTLVRLCNDEEAWWLAQLEQSEAFIPEQLTIFDHIDFFFRAPLAVPSIQELSNAADLFFARSFRALPQELLSNPRFVEMALKIKSQSFKRLRPWFLCLVRSQLRDRDIAKLAIQTEPMCATILEPDLLKDRELLLMALDWSGDFLRFADPSCQADKDIVLLAVQQPGLALEFASASLRDDPEVVMMAVRQQGEALQFAPPELQEQRDIVIAAIQQSGMALAYAAPALRADRELASLAVQRAGDALQFVDVELLGDREIVALALGSSGRALEFAPLALRSDYAMVLLGLQQTALAFEYASPELQANEEVQNAAVRLAAKREVEHFELDSDSKSEEEQIVQVIISKGLRALKLGSVLQSALLARRDFALAAVQHCPKTYMRLPENLRADPNVALAVVKKNGLFLLEVPHGTRNNFNIQVAAALQNRLALNLMLPTDRKRVANAADRREAEIARQSVQAAS